jgi:SagB-type dehydrogenase family enzyme
VRPAEPARRTDLPDGPRIALPVPAGPRDDEPTLWEASSSRRSIRAFAESPVPLADLGELLWRTLRVIRVLPADDQVPYDRIHRPVPSGGAMHAIELWLVCARVEGVPAGLWRYDPFTHELVGRDAGPGQADVLPSMVDADGVRPPVTALLTTRHARTSWKYGGIALALELKDVGVIMEAVQLTASALGLGMCPWGSGPVEGLARVLGIDPEIDMPIGEFVLGVPA